MSSIADKGGMIETEVPPPVSKIGIDDDHFAGVSTQQCEVSSLPASNINSEGHATAISSSTALSLQNSLEQNATSSSGQLTCAVAQGFGSFFCTKLPGKLFQYSNYPFPCWTKVVIPQHEKKNLEVMYYSPDGETMVTRTNMQSYIRNNKLPKETTKYFQFNRICCVCHTVEDAQVYIECSYGRAGCAGWVHPVCVGLGDVDFKNLNIICPLCTEYIEAMGAVMPSSDKQYLMLRQRTVSESNEERLTYDPNATRKETCVKLVSGNHESSEALTFEECSAPHIRSGLETSAAVFPRYPLCVSDASTPKDHVAPPALVNRQGTRGLGDTGPTVVARLGTLEPESIAKKDVGGPDVVPRVTFTPFAMEIQRQAPHRLTDTLPTHSLCAAAIAPCPVLTQAQCDRLSRPSPETAGKHLSSVATAVATTSSFQMDMFFGILHPSVEQNTAEIRGECGRPSEPLLLCSPDEQSRDHESLARFGSTDDVVKALDSPVVEDGGQMVGFEHDLFGSAQVPCALTSLLGVIPLMQTEAAVYPNAQMSDGLSPPASAASVETVSLNCDSNKVSEDGESNIVEMSLSNTGQGLWGGQASEMGQNEYGLLSRSDVGAAVYLKSEHGSPPAAACRRVPNQGHIVQEDEATLLLRRSSRLVGGSSRPAGPLCAYCMTPLPIDVPIVARGGDELEENKLRIRGGRKRKRPYGSASKVDTNTSQTANQPIGQERCINSDFYLHQTCSENFNISSSVASSLVSTDPDPSDRIGATAEQGDLASCYICRRRDGLLIVTEDSFSVNKRATGHAWCIHWMRLFIPGASRLSENPRLARCVRYSDEGETCVAERSAACHFCYRSSGVLVKCVGHCCNRFAHGLCALAAEEARQVDRLWTTLEFPIGDATHSDSLSYTVCAYLCPIHFTV